MHMIFGGNPGSSKRRRIIHWWSIFSARRDRYYDIASGNGKPQRGCHCDICRVPGTYAGVPWQKSRYAVQNCISGEIWGLLQPELPGREKCIGISSGNSMHKAGGECLTWDSCEIPAEEEERVDPRERTALNISFSESPVSGGRFSGDGRGAGWEAESTPGSRVRQKLYGTKYIKESEWVEAISIRRYMRRRGTEARSDPASRKLDRYQKCYRRKWEKEEGYALCYWRHT